MIDRGSKRAGLVSFGEAIRGPANARLREKLIALASKSITRPLYVDTLLGIAAKPAPSALLKRRVWFLLVDVHQIILFDNPEAANAPRVDSVVQFAIDDHSFRPFGILAEYLDRNPFRFLYGLETLDLLPLLWSSDRPGTAVRLNLITGEIESAHARVHPTAGLGGLKSERRRADSKVRSERLELGSDTAAGPGWRTSPAFSMDDLRPSCIGIVRAERQVMSEASIPGTVTRISWNKSTAETICGAKSFKPSEAVFTARCEAAERYQVALRPPEDELVHSSFSDVADRAIDPQSIFFRITGPTGGRPPVGYSTYDASTPLYWTWAYSLSHRVARLVPAQEVWFNTEALAGEHIFIGSTTNACAVGCTFQEASLFSMLEAIERDAYLTMWYLRRRCEKVRPHSIQLEQFQLLWARIRSRFPNYSFHLFDIGNDVCIPTVLAAAVRNEGEGPRTLLAAAARPCAERALLTALKDLAGELRDHTTREETDRWKGLLDKPELIVQPEHHRDLYALDEVFDRLAFLGFDAEPRLPVGALNERSVIKPRSSYNLGELLDRIVRHLGDLGIEVLLKDMTHSDLARRGLRCVKSVLPGLYPIWFGHERVRFSITERLRRLSQNTVGRLVMGESDLNLEVHPMS